MHLCKCYGYLITTLHICKNMRVHVAKCPPSVLSQFQINNMSLVISVFFLFFFSDSLFPPPPPPPPHPPPPPTHTPRPRPTNFFEPRLWAAWPISHLLHYSLLPPFFWKKNKTNISISICRLLKIYPEC